MFIVEIIRFAQKAYAYAPLYAYPAVSSYTLRYASRASAKRGLERALRAESRGYAMGWICEGGV